MFAISKYREKLVLAIADNGDQFRKQLPSLLLTNKSSNKRPKTTISTRRDFREFVSSNH